MAGAVLACTVTEFASGIVTVRFAVKVPLSWAELLVPFPTNTEPNGSAAVPIVAPPAVPGVNPPVNPDMLVAIAAPIFGVVNTGDTENTKLPVPVDPVTSPIATGPKLPLPTALPLYT